MKKFLQIFLILLLAGFQVNAQLASVSVGPVTNIGSSSVTLNGEISESNFLFDTDVNYYFEYSENSDFSSSSQTLQVDNFTVASSENVVANIAGLNPETQYYFRLYAEESNTPANNNITDGTANFYTYSEVFANAISGFTVTPTSSTSLDLAWTASDGATTDGYLILYTTGAIAPDPSVEVSKGVLPINQAYTNKTIIGSDVTETVSIGSLSPATQYSFVIIPYNNDATNTEETTNYNITTNSAISAYTLATEPTADPTTAAITAKDETEISITYDAVADADGYLVLYKSGGTAPAATGVTDGEKTLDGSEFTDADGYQFVQGSASTNSTITGLSAQTRYSFRIIAFSHNSDISETYNYRTNGITLTSVYTLTLEPTTAVANIQKIDASFDFVEFSFDSYTFPVGNNGFLIYYQSGATAPDISTLADGYSPSAQPILSVNYNEETSGSATTITANNAMSPGTKYTFLIVPYGFDGTNNETYNYNLAGATPITAWTLSAAPTAIPANPTLESKSDNSLTISYDAAAGASGYLILYKKSSTAPTNAGLTQGMKHSAAADFTNADGFQYADGNLNTEVEVTGLDPTSRYSFLIIPYAYALDGGIEVEESYRYRNNGREFTHTNNKTTAEIPATAVTGFIKTAVTSTGASFSYDQYTDFADDGGFVLYYETGNSVDLSGLVNGNIPANQPTMGTDYVVQNTDLATTITIPDGDLSAGTKYSFSIIPFNYDGSFTNTIGYNSIGAPTLTHYTLASPANGGAGVANNANFKFDNISSSSLDLSWDAVTGADGYLVVYEESSSSIDLTNLADGIAPGSLSISGVTIVDNSNATTTSIAGLSATTAYAFHVIPYTYADDSGPVAETYNYNKNSPQLKTVTTACVAPDSQAAFDAVGPADISAVSIDLSWAAVASADKYLVIAKEASAVNLTVTNTDDFESVANADFSDAGNDVTGGNNIIYSGAGTSVTVTGLSNETVYHFAIYAYNDGSFCYNGDVAGTVSAETEPALSNNTLTYNSGAVTIHSVNNDVTGTYITVFDFDMTDGGSDGSDTKLTDFSITYGSADDFIPNTISWNDIIADARVVNTTPATNQAVTATVNASDISVTIANNNNNNSTQFGFIPESGTVNMKLQIRLRDNISATDIDGKNFVFQLDPSSINVENSSSSFSTAGGTTIETATTENEIVVAASKYVFTTQPPATVNAGEDVNTTIAIEARDANNNLDINYSTAFSISNTDGITMQNVPTAFVNGELTFANNFNYQGSGVGTIAIEDDVNLFTSSSNAVTVKPSITLSELTSGLNSGTLQSGTTDQAVLGFSLTALGTAELNELTLDVDQDLTALVDNVRFFSSNDNSFDGTDTDLAATLVIDNVLKTISISSLTESITSTSKYYFLVVDVDESVNEFDNSNLEFSLSSSDIVFDETANLSASSFSKSYSFKDIIQPEVVNITNSPTLLSGADVGTDVLQIVVEFNEEMDDGTAPIITFPVEDPATSLSGLTASSGWSADKLSYTAYYDFSNQGVDIQNIDVKVAAALDLSGNLQVNHTETDLFSIDTQNPTATISLSVSTLNRSDNTNEIEISFSEEMDNTVAPTITINGTTYMSVDGSGTWSVGNTIYTISYTHDLTEEEVLGANFTAADAKDVAGNTMTSNTSTDFDINTTRAKINQITPNTANGLYKAGDVIDIVLTFDENVSVSGVPELDLNAGGIAIYSSTLNSEVTFKYTVGTGQNTADLDVTAIRLEGGSILNTAANNPSDLTLPSSPNRLRDNAAIQIDTKKPSISKIIAGTANGIYGPGETIDITVVFDEDIQHSGTAAVLTMNTGATAIFNSVKNGNELSFTYTIGAVGSGENTTALDVASISTSENEITDIAGNNSDLSLPTNPNRLQDNAAIVIDTKAPTVTNVASNTANGIYKAGDIIEITITYDEPVNVTAIPELNLNTGDVAKYKSGSGSSTLVFEYKVQTADNTVLFDVTDLEYANSNGLVLKGGTIIDAANIGAKLTLPALGTNSLGDNADLTIDTTKPEVTLGLDISAINRAANQLTVTATFNEKMNPAVIPSFQVNGTSNLPKDPGGAWTSGDKVYTVVFTHNLTEEELTGINIDISGGADVVGNTAVSATSADFTVDTQRPRITKIISASADGLYSPGQVVNIRLIFDENVAVSGVPTLDLNSGGTASFTSVTAGNQVNFKYTVGAIGSGENTSDLDVTQFNMNGGAIKDIAGNNATIVLPSAPNRLQDNAAIQIDTDPATVLNVTSTSANGFYRTGDNISITITFDEAVKVAGQPILMLNSGDKATYASGDGSTALVFNYVVSEQDGVTLFDVADLNYIDINSLKLNGGTINDLAGINAVLSLPPSAGAGSLGTNKDISIDTQAPGLGANPFSPQSGALNVSHSLVFSIKMNEPASGAGTGNIRIVNAQTGNVQATLDGASAFTNNTVNQLDFNSLASILEDSTEYYFEFDAGAIVDRAGNKFAGFTGVGNWSFTSFGPPRIDSFSIGACVGEVFTIEGQYFTGVSRIRTNVGAARITTISTFTIIDDNNIEFTIPAGTEPGIITLDKLNGQNGNTGNASTTSTENIKIGPSSAELVLVNTGSDALCDSPEGGSPIETQISVNIVGGTGTYTLVYSNGTSVITETGYTDGQILTVNPPKSGVNTYSIISLTDEDSDLNSCSAPSLGADLDITEYERSTVEAGGYFDADIGHGVIDICLASISQIDFSDPAIVNNLPSITGNVTSGKWTIDFGPSQNGGGFSPNGSVKTTTNIQPIYYPSLADAAEGKIVLRLVSDNPPVPNPCVPNEDLVTIRFVSTITAQPGQKLAICKVENENGNNEAFALLDASVGGGANGVVWSRVDQYAEAGAHDGTWGFADNVDALTFTLTSTNLDAIYKASPSEMNGGLAILEIIPTATGGGCDGTPAPRQLEISIYDLPAPSKSLGSEIVCSGEEGVRFRMAASSSQSVFNWSLTNKGIDIPGLNDKNEIDGLEIGNLLIVNFREVNQVTQDTLIVHEINTLTGCVSKADTFFIELKPLPIAEILYNSTTTLSNSAAPILLRGQGGISGDLQAGGTFTGAGVVQNSNGDFYLDTRQLAVTDLTATNDVHTVTFTYQSEFGCTSSSQIDFNVFDAETIFPALANEYCESYASDTISVDLAIVPQGFFVSKIAGPGITEIGTTPVIIGNDTTDVLRAIFNPKQALIDNAGNSNPSEISITYSIEDPDNPTNNANNVGEQNIIVNPLPALEFTIPEYDFCTYGESVELKPINSNTGNNYSFEVLNDSLPTAILTGSSLVGFEFSPGPLLDYLSERGKDSITVRMRYAYQDVNTCQNSEDFSFIVYRQPTKPTLESVDLCVVNGIINEAVVLNYTGNLANQELKWYRTSDLSGEPVGQGERFQPTSELLGSNDSVSFFVVRKNVNSSGEDNNLCESNSTQVIYRRVDNPNVSWNKSTFGDGPVIFLASFNDKDFSSYNWSIDKLEKGSSSQVLSSQDNNITDSTLSVDFSEFGAGRYELTFSINTVYNCTASVTKSLLILPKLLPMPSFEFDFDDNNEGWVSAAFGNAANSWEFAKPGAESNIVTAGNVWITNPNGGYAPNEYSFVYSPAMDLSAIDQPFINFDLWVDVLKEIDGLILEYSTDTLTIEDPNRKWLKLGNFSNGISSGLNWYNLAGISSRPGTDNTSNGQTNFNNVLAQGWSIGSEGDGNVRMRNAKHTLANIPVGDRKNIVFRFQFRSASNLNLPDGVAFDNFRVESLNRNVLVEYFGDDREPSDQIEMNSLQNAFVESGNFAWLNYRIDENDPLYRNQAASMLSRIFFYDAYDASGLFALDGMMRTAFTFNQEGRNEVNSARLVSSAVLLDISAEKSAEGTLDIRVKQSTNKVLPESSRLYIAVVHSEINGGAQGTNPNKTYYNVLRKLVPGAAGIDVSGMTNQTHNVSYTASDKEDENQLGIVAFIQNTETNEVLQSAYLSEVDLLTFGEVTATDEWKNLRVKLYPNPARDFLTIDFSGSIDDDISARLIDVTGKIVKDFRIDKGSKVSEIDISELKSGLYSMLLTTTAGKHKVIKFVVSD